jgi:hypothetical protein
VVEGFPSFIQIIAHISASFTHVIFLDANLKKLASSDKFIWQGWPIILPMGRVTT